MTNRNKKDSIRGRMTETGEPFNVARRKVGASAAGQAPEDEDPWELIEVEVASDKRAGSGHQRHIETFWGRWVLAPDPEKTRTIEPNHPEGAYYGVAQTRRGRIAIYTAMSNPLWPGRLVIRQRHGTRLRGFPP